MTISKAKRDIIYRGGTIKLPTHHSERVTRLRDYRMENEDDLNVFIRTSFDGCQLLHRPSIDSYSCIALRSMITGLRSVNFRTKCMMLGISCQSDMLEAAVKFFETVTNGKGSFAVKGYSMEYGLCEIGTFVTLRYHEAVPEHLAGAHYWDLWDNEYHEIMKDIPIELDDSDV